MIDDEPNVALGLKRLLHSHEVAMAHSGDEARVLLEQLRFDVVVSDVMMPEPSGMDLYAALVGEQHELARRFIFVTGGVCSEAARAFLARIPNAKLQKPVDPHELAYAIARVVQGDDDVRSAG